jgi:hypothetical protein
MWVDPDIVDATKMIPLRNLIQELEAMTEAQREAIAENFCAAQELEYPGPVQQIRQYLAQARSDGDLARQIVRAAASINELRVYALRPNTDTAYPLRTLVWSQAGSLHDVDRSLETGHFAIDPLRFDARSAEREVGGRPLLIEKKMAVRMLRRRPPSKAQALRVGEMIVAEFLRKNPGKVLLKNDFIALFKKSLPGSRTEVARGAWGPCALPQWRRRGARPRTNRYQLDK